MFVALFTFVISNVFLYILRLFLFSINLLVYVG